MDGETPWGVYKLVRQLTLRRRVPEEVLRDLQRYRSPHLRRR